MWMAVAAVVAGFAVWSVLWVGGNSVFQAQGLVPPANQRIDAVSSLAAMLLLSVIASIASGYLTQWIGGRTAAWVLAAILLAVGIGVQYSLRALMPVWYHAIFLLLIVPAVVAGAMLRS